MKEKFKLFFAGKQKILILGFGREGRSTYRFLTENFPELTLGIADRNEAIGKEEYLSARLYLGKNYLQAVHNYDLVIKSPGVFLGDFYNAGKLKTTSQTDMFLQIFGSQTIGVTGTKGKSTTAALIYHLLKSSGRDSLIMGNMGFPAFDSIEKIHSESLIVYELSAHQLEYVHHSTHIGVLLNLFPEHLDYFRDYESYQAAKLNIFNYQEESDIAICGQSITSIRNCYIMKKPEDELEYLVGGKITGSQLLQMSRLKGSHNLGNILIALRVVKLVGLSPKTALKYLSTFQPLPHRLEYVGCFGGVEFYNDSISTIPQSTMAAVSSLENTDVLILGGFDRGIDYSSLVDFLLNSDISHFFFLGKAGQRMYDLFQQDCTVKNLFKVACMEDVFEVLKISPEIHSCLLSPAAASYDQFHNFEHRGDIFKELAKTF